MNTNQLRGKAPRQSPVHHSSNNQDGENDRAMISTISAMRRDIQALQACTWGRAGNFPPALKRSLTDCLKCKICQGSPFSPPIILAKCCSNIIGCQGCVDAWFSGADALTKACPICKCERGYAHTSRFHGIDELCEVLESSKLLDDAATE